MAKATLARELIWQSKLSLKLNPFWKAPFKNVFCLCVAQPISFYMVVTKAEGDCCEPLSKTTVKDEEQIQEVTASHNLSVPIAREPIWEYECATDLSWDLYTAQRPFLVHSLSGGWNSACVFLRVPCWRRPGWLSQAGSSTEWPPACKNCSPHK